MSTSCKCFANATLLLALATSLGAQDISESRITAEDRDHWSFQPLQRPEVPTPASPDWCHNAIDRFIAVELEQKQITPQQPANRHIVIRRLSFDLTGLPPTPHQLNTFINDDSPGAYERLVDRLLNSHHYGEHWAQYWLDLARFAETDGFEFDAERMGSWKYRDWVIDALNGDMPYDQFVRLQLAGQGDHEVATIFCLSGSDMPDINSQEERRQNVLNELTGTVGSTLLGLQVGCAQCHDHKYDPISQADFYRLRAIFEPAVHVVKNKSLSTLRERGSEFGPSHLMIRGDWRRKGPQLQPGVPRIASATGQHFAPTTTSETTGRRGALADWVTSRNNPLTARVIANRVWQYHFGAGLSRTPSDFGTIGDAPSHPTLLDWLATELIDHDWSLKHLHRVIVTSATYRQPSTGRESVDRDPTNLWLGRFHYRRLSGEAIRDAMLQSSGWLHSGRGGRGVMAPLPDELLKTLLKNQWKTSPHKRQHYRRSIYLFARRNLRYPIFDAFDRPDGNASCPRRSESTTAPQSLLLLNSALSLDAARRLAGTLLDGDPHINDSTFRDLFRRAACRELTSDEVNELAAFHAKHTQLLTSEARPAAELALPLPRPAKIDPYAAAALTDMCLAMFTSNEFIYID